MNFKNFFLILLIFSSFLPAESKKNVSSQKVGGKSEKIQKNKTCKLKILDKFNRSIIINAEIVDTDFSRMKGLMYRKNLHKKSGMLFVFPYEKMLNFWMKNTYIPLSIAYIDKLGIINEIYHMKPLDTSTTYPSKLPAKYALEVNKGWFSKNKITAGYKVILNGCISK